MKHAVVVYDPTGNEPEGEILTGNAIGVAKARGAVLLPVELDLLRRGGASGWSKRSYGRGWRYNAVAAARGCPLVLHMTAGFPVVEWVARVVADDPEGAPTNTAGSLRLATDTAQAGASASGLAPDTSPVSIPALGAPDAGGGWTIGGRARAMVTSDMLLALQLYGQIGGARVLWFAASQTR